jgi:hypothetical protein
MTLTLIGPRLRDRRFFSRQALRAKRSGRANAVLIPNPGPPAINAAKTHCIHGHEFTPENTYWITTHPGKLWRHCKECQRLRNRLRLN